MIRVSGKDLLRPVELLRQHAAHQKMRPSGLPEGKQQISLLANLIGETIRTADCEGKSPIPASRQVPIFFANAALAMPWPRSSSAKRTDPRVQPPKWPHHVYCRPDRRFPAETPNGVVVDNFRKDRARRRAVSGRRRRGECARCRPLACAALRSPGSGSADHNFSIL